MYEQKCFLLMSVIVNWLGGLQLALSSSNSMADGTFNWLKLLVSEATLGTKKYLKNIITNLILA